MKKSNFISINSFTSPIGEAVSTKTDVIPGQSYSIGELLERATRGQRLNVSIRKQDWLPDEDPDHKYDEKNYRKKGDQDYNDAPADIQDRVEFDAFVAEHEARKREYVATLARLKKEKEDAAERAKQSEKKDDADK